MPKPYIDLTNKVYGKLTVLKDIGIIKHRRFWQCICQCGITKNIPARNLIIGKTKSCGCSTNEFLSISKTKHGMAGTLTHNSWLSMKHRCTYSSNPSFKYYGAKGIKICERWLNSFDNFFADMGLRPSKEYSLDRINSNGNYELSNCRWATASEQNFNKNNNIYIEYNGESGTILFWSFRLNIPKYLIENRLKAGWTIERTLTAKWKKYAKNNIIIVNSDSLPTTATDTTKTNQADTSNPKAN
jgi:hypothetical protein